MRGDPRAHPAEPGASRDSSATLGLMAERASELGGKLLALVILLAAAYVLFKLVLGFVAAVAWVAVAVIAVVAALWALNRIL